MAERVSADGEHVLVVGSEVTEGELTFLERAQDKVGLASELSFCDIIKLDSEINSKCRGGQDRIQAGNGGSFGLAPHDVVCVITFLHLFQIDGTIIIANRKSSKPEIPTSSGQPR